MRLAAALSAFLALSVSPAGAGTPASAQEATPADSATEAAVVPAAPVSSGIRVYVDPETGLRTTEPTAEQRRAAAAQDALNRNLDGHENFTYETQGTGAVILRTHGRNQSVVVAKPGGNGKASIQCTDPLHQHVPGSHAGAAEPESAPADER